MNRQSKCEIKLNDKLLLDQGVPPKAEEAILLLHTLLDDVKADPNEYGTPIQVLEVVKCMEYTLQSLWRFPLSSNFHMHQFYIDGCLCPKLDNKERFGSGYFVYSMDCPFHSAMLEQKDKECEVMRSMIV